MIWVLVLTMIVTAPDGTIKATIGGVTPHATQAQCEAAKAEVTAAVRAAENPNHIVIMGCSSIRLPERT